MTQEDKKLLLQDLCGRLPYRVFMGNKEWNRKPYQLTCDEVQYMMMSDDYEDVPYLRPLSSMTEEEKVEYCDLQDKFLLGSQYPVTDGHILFDWLNKKMFDYRGLIPKGLAISTDMTKEELKKIPFHMDRI